MKETVITYISQMQEFNLKKTVSLFNIFSSFEFLKNHHCNVGVILAHQVLCSGLTYLETKRVRTGLWWFQTCVFRVQDHTWVFHSGAIQARQGKLAKKPTYLLCSSKTLVMWL